MADDIAAAPTAREDEQRLHELGYAQELRRRMSGFSNFAVSFTIISILSGCLTLYGYGMNTGGPAIIVWGWPIVGLFTLTVGLAMAEVCSSFPTAGGLYYWSAKLARRNGPAWYPDEQFTNGDPLTEHWNGSSWTVLKPPRAVMSRICL